jgi:hypothetical protein
VMNCLRISCHRRAQGVMTFQLVPPEQTSVGLPEAFKT